ncbi:MAG TPA: hypothetical protein VFP92_10615 [Rhodanobacteraceae bacterium]|nr:hypothetical protein [Rhodanobacteraceae bacterium]
MNTETIDTLVQGTKTFQATMRLRVVKPVPDFSAFGGPAEWKLQQAWLCREDGTVQWRNVEVTRLPADEYDAV